MSGTCMVSLLLALVYGAGLKGGEGFESPEAYAIVAAAAVPVLPPPLRIFFEDHAGDLQESAAMPFTSLRATDESAGQPDVHFVLLDTAARSGTRKDRRAAARSFPHSRQATATLFKRYAVKHGGSLPWVLHDRYAALLAAMQSDDARSIVREAGAVLQFATDAALPFNTTSDEIDPFIDQAQEVGERKTARHSRGELRRTARIRFQRELLRRFRGRFDYEVRVAPQRYRILPHPLEAIFTVLLDGHEALDPLLTIDAESLDSLGVIDSGSFEAASDAYYDRLADRAIPVMESRLEEAALLGANLIGTAWVQAGQPSPARWTSAGRTGKATSKEAAGQTYVGSRHSTIFHRSSCPFVKRIKPGNRVEFRTIQQAHEAGRTPCRRCKPDRS